MNLDGFGTGPSPTRARHRPEGLARYPEGLDPDPAVCAVGGPLLGVWVDVVRCDLSESPLFCFRDSISSSLTLIDDSSSSLRL